ncbi:helix-turn-helix transcriptional regulator [Mameliella sediminis]|uniref:helix-turn-helix transcriptional regulator n=1 Tax=Mameliella sediminis TaxID=2836866 RepID=UPI001C43D7FF|nr:AlpA family phage regulatory protein [Mameliella sediminis]MBV7394119.1 AlpA family phage regulatory protein [Mameliella sediminis]
MTERIARMPEANKITGKSRSATYNALNPKSPYYDPTFPKPVKVGSRAIGFHLSELEAWVASRQRVEI